MARKLRVQYEGAIYHVMSRGDHQDPVFRSDEDRELFLEMLAEVCARTGWQIHAWCLMKTHFHLVLETPRADLVARMKWFLGTYTRVLTGGIAFSATCLAVAIKHGIFSTGTGERKQ